MTVYADMLFAVNALSNALLLYSYCFFYEIKRRHAKLAAASAAGAVYAVAEALFNLPRLLRGGVIIGMVYIAFGKAGLLKHTARIMLMCFAVEGITLAAMSAFGAGAALEGGGVVLFASEPLCAILYITAYPIYFLFSRLKARERKYIRLKIKYNQRAVTFDVLRDSGNLLKYHGRPVIMTAWEAMSPLFDYTGYAELKDKTDAFAIYETVNGAGVVPIIEGAECEIDGVAADSAVAVVERKFKGKYYGIAGDEIGI